MQINYIRGHWCKKFQTNTVSASHFDRFPTLHETSFPEEGRKYDSPSTFADV